MRENIPMQTSHHDIEVYLLILSSIYYRKTTQSTEKTRCNSSSLVNWIMTTRMEYAYIRTNCCSWHERLHRQKIAFLRDCNSILWLQQSDRLLCVWTDWTDWWRCTALTKREMLDNNVYYTRKSRTSECILSPHAHFNPPIASMCGGGGNLPTNPVFSPLHQNCLGYSGTLPWLFLDIY